jgi:hypothetical protein
MSRIRMTIDRLVLNGIEPLEGKALSQALRSQLSDILANRAARGEWARSHRTPAIKVRRMPLEAGTSGAEKFGRQVAMAVGKGLKQ